MFIQRIQLCLHALCILEDSELPSLLSRTPYRYWLSKVIFHCCKSWKDNLTTPCAKGLLQEHHTDKVMYWDIFMMPKISRFTLCWSPKPCHLKTVSVLPRFSPITPWSSSSSAKKVCAERRKKWEMNKLHNDLVMEDKRQSLQRYSVIDLVPPSYLDYACIRIYIYIYHSFEPQDFSEYSFILPAHEGWR